MPITSLRVTGQVLGPGVNHPSCHYVPVISALLLTSSPITAHHQTTAQSSRSFWWSRREWTSYLDTGIQKHIQRQGRILKHKYVRALRRSAQWERSPKHSHVGAGWRLASSWYRDTNRPGNEDKTEKGKGSESKLEDEEPARLLSEYQARKEMFMTSFEEFKKRIDADPYGALFGRKLQKLCYHPRRDGWPGSSWLLKARVLEEQHSDINKRTRRDVNINEDWDTAFWEIVPEKSEGEKNLKKEPAASSKVLEDENIDAASVKPMEPIPRLQSAAIEEFEFDPISMRKVPKKKHAVITPKEMLKPILGEEIEIPVKTFKGYQAQFERSKPPSSEIVQQNNPGTPPRITRGSGNSIKIDPTRGPMAFHDTSSEVINLDPRTSTKAAKNWLTEEGFVSKPSNTAGNSDPSPLPKYSIESSKDHIEKVEPSMDRIRSAPKLGVKETSRKPLYKENDSKAEDLDLLRASDIRSSPRFTRSLKHDLEIESRKKREKLEESYKKMQNAETQEQVKETEEAIKQLLTTRKAFKELASILSSETTPRRKEYLLERFDQLGADFLGLQRDASRLGSRLKKELKLKNGLADEIEMQKAAMRAAETRGSRKVMPSTFFQANNYAGGGFARSVVAHEKKAREIKEAEKAKEKALVREIRSIYEDTYGVLDSKHRQPGCTPNTTAQETAQREEVKPSPILQHQALDQESRPMVDWYGTPVSKLGQERAEVEISGLKAVAQTKSEKNLGEEMMAVHRATVEKKKWLVPHAHRRLYAGEILINEATIWMNSIRGLRRELEEHRTLVEQARALPKFVEPDNSIEHRSSSPPVRAPVSPAAPSLYKVLAYDSSTLKVTIAETTSSILSTNEAPLSPAEALARLNNAAKFLPHFSSLQNAGYEIVSGTGDLLIFKKVREPVMAAPDTISTVSHLAPWEIELQEAQSTSSSPITSNNPSTSSRPHSSARTIKRTETVFSGQTNASSSTQSEAESSSEPNPKTRTKRSKSSFVFWGAVWTGASAVAFSVVRNFFRVGTEEEREVDWLGGTRKQR